MIGRTVSHYLVLEKLGAGGMGVVYKAKDLKLDRPVALKFLPAYLTADAEEKRRFLEEARAASALDHSNIGVVYEVDETPEGEMFIAMAFYEGETLKAHMARGVSLPRALAIAREIAQGLAKAHAEGVIHRDIKPANIILTAEGIPKIIDFGLARRSDVTVTLEGISKGTPAYMSPEQARGGAVGLRTDLWSLGVVMYEMIAGRPPFQGANQTAVVHSILYEEPPPLAAPPRVRSIIAKALQKDPARRYGSAGEMEKDLAAALPSAARPRPRWTRPAMGSAAVLLIVLAAAGAWLYRGHAKTRWARQQALPEIARLAQKEQYSAALVLAREAERYISGDAALSKAWFEISREVSIETTPAGADVALKDYSAPDAPWVPIGRSPMPGVRVPLGLLRWQVSKPGFSTVYEAHTSMRSGGRITFELKPEGLIPAGMVRVPGGPIGFTVAYLGNVGGFDAEPYFIDKYEVTNRGYKEFVDRGGYSRREFWKQPFVKDGRTIAWEQAMAGFRDATGRPGPAVWEAGRYPQGQDEYPVSGVSWYEAAAYAEFAGKSLPTISHWYRAADPNTALYVVPLSNFSRTGPAAAGKYQGISAQGAYDMAGNVKEWCWNDTGSGLRYILGGAWSEPSYQFYQPDAQSPWDRSPANGFRCVKYTAPPAAAALASKPPIFRDFSKEKPVSDQMFALFRSIYAYDRRDADGKTESVDDSSEFWRKEKVSYAGAAPGERIPAYLFLPRNRKPPFQTVLYFPSAAALQYTASERLEGKARWEFLPATGRAVLYPIYLDTFERRRDRVLTAVEYRDRLIQWSKEVRRSVDYIDSRPDLDQTHVAYMGASMGAANAPILAAFEDRLRACVLQDAGFYFAPRPPEIDQLNFAPRLRVPTLMLSGRYDFTFPYATSQVPMLKWLGAPAGQKRHAIFDTAHDVSIKRNEMIREVLDWLDRYLGKVQ